MITKRNYNIRILSNDETYISVIAPYDLQDYYYAIGNDIYRDGIFIKRIAYGLCITDELDELNTDLKSMIDRS